ncbi:hypothetical protein [Clostridium butyricum]|uniref:hypothetical protein n=1 Tax=Clostridium butyricum TaxID=1492 RepID=UPI0005C13E63|nr:hypothetical protein [Clostridium butyricum]MDU4852868.1 hypothetical protein [Clostridioides difficile]KIU07852.1 hypothetical protein SC08_Contig83orf01781 [Clostridium butyricum]MBA8967680.1 putative nucleic acid-binding Zn-ribbon protein [Clostridium butyricum]MBA8971252.1 putative nucleic acid-binding Zn-ribbon protein [Clostridium butyricum]MBC2427574.1 hypothetical protein [Clostridium butyricum]
MDKSNEMFELMTKMYSEMQDGFSSVNQRLDKVESRLDTVENKLNSVETEVTKTNITIENDIKPKIEALFDGYKQNTEAINLLSDKIDDLQADINNLTIRTLKNENNIINFSKVIKSNNRDAQ